MNTSKQIPGSYIPGQQDILEATPLDKVVNVLDIGVGRGTSAKFFIKKGKHVTAIGTNFEEYLLDVQELRKQGINLIDCLVENMPLADQSFDAVWMSHTLEHTMNISIALQSARRVLKDNGWLWICVPPYKSRVVGGHIHTGWNIGQLMYVLLLNGFDVKNGHFVKHGYNIVAFVRKSARALPILKFDRNDIDRLKDYWPQPLKQGFEGGLSSLNWIGFKTNYLFNELSLRKKIQYCIRKINPFYQN